MDPTAAVGVKLAQRLMGERQIGTALCIKQRIFLCVLVNVNFADLRHVCPLIAGVTGQEFMKLLLSVRRDRKNPKVEAH